MELVRGIKITDYCDQNNLADGGAARAVHRRSARRCSTRIKKGSSTAIIKPSNILVTLHDGVPVPKVIDFGVAKATQGSGSPTRPSSRSSSR